MSKTRLLVVDDDASGRRWLGKLLLKEGYEVDVAGDGAEALELIALRAPALVITDLNMPRMSGLDLLSRVRQSHPGIAMVMVTAQDHVASAVAAMRAGAKDYLTKPIDFDVLRLTVERTLSHLALVSEADSFRRQLRDREGAGLGELVGTSPAMQGLYHRIRQVAAARAPVLIRGEVGTGRATLARTIHAQSGRSGAFVELSSDSLPDDAFLLDSPGDQEFRPSPAQRADGGTLCITDVGALSTAAQARLLKMLDTLADASGAEDSAVPDVRVLGVTRRDLTAAAREGSFLQELLYRLAVVELEVPVLRLRGGDVVLLAEHFLQRAARDGRRAVQGLSEAARRKILTHTWPGNLPELRRAVEHASLFGAGELLEPDAFDFEGVPCSSDGIRIPGSTMAEIEKHVILQTFEATDGSTARTAELLDVSLRTIQYRLAEYGIPTRRGRA
jgi:two-component system response regulator HydG